MRFGSKRMDLENYAVEKGLDVNVDCDLTFSNHMNFQLDMANKLLAVVRKSSGTGHCLLSSMLQINIVCSHLDSGNM